MNSEQCHNTNAIRTLNDRFRCQGVGNGMIMVTRGVHAEGDDFVASVVNAVRDFDQFDRDNDPHGEHDFGALEVAGSRIFFKIDYYDLGLSAHSSNPADDSVTRRVLTIMLASEY